MAKYRIFYITDTHFNHQKLVDDEYRPRNYQHQIIKYWKNNVNQNDLIIHGGDVIFSNASEMVDILSELPGRKVLVRGNHDRKPIHYYMRNGFDFCCDSFVLNDVYFTHEPANFLPPNTHLNIHGHLHSGEHRKHEYDIKPFNRLVSLEKIGYKLFLLDYLKEKKNE